MAPLQTLLRDLGSCRKSIFICLISNNHRKHSDSDRRDRTLTLKALSTDQCKNAATTVERGSPAHNHLINARSYHVSASLTFQQGRGKVDKVGGRAQGPSQYFLSGILPLSSAFNSSSPTPPSASLASISYTCLSLSDIVSIHRGHYFYLILDLYLPRPQL